MWIKSLKCLLLLNKFYSTFKESIENATELTKTTTGFLVFNCNVIINRISDRFDWKPIDLIERTYLMWEPQKKLCAFYFSMPYLEGKYEVHCQSLKVLISFGYSSHSVRINSKDHLLNAIHLPYSVLFSESLLPFFFNFFRIDMALIMTMDKIHGYVIFTDTIWKTPDFYFRRNKGDGCVYKRLLLSVRTSPHKRNRICKAEYISALS